MSPGGGSTHNLDEALDAYIAAVADVGGPAPSEPLSEAELRDMDEALALALPAELRTVWTRFQRAPLLPFPDWIPGSLALEIHSDDTGPVPPTLFPVAYQSHVELCVDLTAPEGSGCPLWQVEIVDGTARRRYASMAAFFTAAAAAVRAGVLSWRGSYSATDDAAWALLVNEGNGRAGAGDDLPTDEVDLNRPLAWPDRWRRLAGIDPEAARPRGRTHDIRALLSHRPSGSATIGGRIVGMAGTPEASRITLDDATERMVVWLPRETDPFRAAVMRAEVELDVMLLPSAGSGDMWDAEMASRQWAVQRAALGHDMASAQSLGLDVMRMLDPSTCDAVALAVRPAPAS